MEAVARDNISRLLTSCRLEDISDCEKRKQSLSELTRFPNLARTRFDLSFPLFHAVGKKWATVEWVTSIYHLFPTAISDKEETDSMYPLHNACHRGAKPEVIRFLIQQFPEAVKVTTDAEHELPIHLACFESATTTETLDLLLDAYPESLVIPERSGYTPLDMAINYCFDPLLIQCLLDRHERGPYPLKKFTIGTGGTPPIFREPPETCTICLALVMNKVESIKCDMFRFDLEGIERALGHLEEATSVIRCLELRLSGPALHQNHATWRRIGRLLSQNYHLRSIHLNVFFLAQERRRLLSPPYDDDKLTILHQSLMGSKSSSIQELKLENFHCADKGAALAGLVRSAGHQGHLSSLTELTLIKLRLFDTRGNTEGVTERLHYASHWRLGDAWRTSCLTKICINSCLLDPESLVALLEELAHVRSLTELELCFHSRYLTEEERDAGEIHLDDDLDPKFPEIEALNITRPIVQILNQGRLEALKIVGPLVDTEGICEALTPSENRMMVTAPLRKYHVLCSVSTEEQRRAFADMLPSNLTLADVELPPIGEGGCSGRKIAYYVELNRWGRARLASAPRPDLVATLAQIGSTMRQSQGQIDAYQLQYGLLRFVPSVWATTTFVAQRRLGKRKREDTGLDTRETSRHLIRCLSEDGTLPSRSSHAQKSG